MLDRRILIGLLGLGIPAGAAFGYAAQSGRIDVLTPVLPDQGDLPPVAGVISHGLPTPGLRREAFSEGVTLLNVWASWCPNCRAEHGELMKLSEREEVRLFGLASDDRDDHVAAYLKEAGNPYQRLSVDHKRVYVRPLKHRGVPQTYVFNANGIFVQKISGELTKDIVAQSLMPAIERAYKMA